MAKLSLQTTDYFSADVLGNNIRYYRKQQGYKAQELANLVHVAQGRTVYKWENAETCPGYDNLFQLAKVFNVSIDALVGLETVNLEIPKELVSSTCIAS